MMGSEKTSLVLLALLFLALHLPFMSSLPLIWDEALYAVNIMEQPSLIPTYLGSEVAWKPPVVVRTIALLSGLW